MIKWIKRILGLEWDEIPNNQPMKEVVIQVALKEEESLPVVKTKAKTKKKKEKWDVDAPQPAGIKKPKQPKKGKK